MMVLKRIKNKLKRHRFGRLLASVIRRAGIKTGILDPQKYLGHQSSAHRVLSRYIPFKGKDVLEIGGSQSGESAEPFLKDGAASVTVTGLDRVADKEFVSGQLRFLRADALSLSSVFRPGSFDVLYGLSIVEHIPTPEVLLDEVYRVLKPGGVAYFEGNPIWSSPKGHHLWVSNWGGPYQRKTTANYLFNEFPDIESTNPLPDWSHLLMTQDQMREYLSAKSLPRVDIECIIDWVYCSDQVNRMNMSEIAEAYTTSRLIVLEANTLRSEVPRDMESALRKHCGEGVDYGVQGVSYVLVKK
jgi:ubiquinone/menaquinone biosynthesis C-methylase UbiE